MTGVGLLGFVCAAGLALLDFQVSPVVIAALGVPPMWGSTALCWTAVHRVGLRRPEVLLAAAAVTSWTLGCTYYVGLRLAAGPVPFAAFADAKVFYTLMAAALLFYALMAAALVVVVRRRARGVAPSMWWDAVVGSLGAAAVLAVALNPLLSPTVTGPRSLSTLELAAYPLCDLVLVAAVAGIAALRDVRMGRRWGVLAAGLLVFAAADVAYAVRTAAGTYVFGTPWDSAWTVGIALIAWWVDDSAREQPPIETRSAGGAMSLAVSSGATVAGVGVLLLNTWVHISTVAVALAGVTLLAAAARSQVAFRLVARLADQRRLAAATDELTGLPNRRALTAEGQACLTAQRGRRKALLVLDLDKFKEVNDSLGHHVGDQLLSGWVPA